jgi:hypothetical protein
MKTTVTATLDYIDLLKWKDLVTKFMQALLKKAAGEFLLDAVPRIPIWTGHARSAFKNLEDVAGKIVAASDYSSGIRLRKDRKGGRQVKILRNEYYYPPSGGRVRKTTQSGREFATKPEDIIDVKGIKLASGRAAFYFKFEIDITYFNLLDRDRWHSFEVGTKIFEDYVKAHINDIPGIENALVRRKVK